MTEDLERLVRQLAGTNDSQVMLMAAPDHFSALRLIRIVGMAKNQEGGLNQISVSEMRQRSFYAGLFGNSQPFVFVIRGLTIPTEELQVFLALPAQDDSLDGRNGALHSVFPGCETAVGPMMDVFMRECENTLTWSAALSGNPSMTCITMRGGEHAPQPDIAQFENLVSCMTGTEWAYVLFGKPVQQSIVEECIGQLATAEKNLVGRFLRKGTSEEQNNPLARQAVDLIKAYTGKYLAGRTEGMWDVNAYLLAKTRAHIDRAIHAASAAFAGPSSAPRPFRARLCRKAEPAANAHEGSVVPFLLTTSEVAALARLPNQEFQGYRMKDRVRFAVASPESALPDSGQKMLNLGSILDEGRKTGAWYKMEADSLCKHAFVAGVPGQGKTQTCFYLLHQLWEQFRIPWLVLEPSSKSEYRQLLASTAFKDELQVFTCGHEGIAPIRVNPLEVLPGIHVQTQIDTLQTLLNSAFAWVPPMPTVLNKALHRVYRDMGWDLAYGNHPRGYIPDVQPTLDDLIATVERLCSELGYSAEVTGNIRAGLQTRLSSLTEGGKGLMLNSRISMPMEELLARPTVLELSAIGDDDEKAFVLGVILLKLAQLRQSEGLSRTGLRHVTVVEEAHRLLKAVPETVGTESANSRGKFVEAFCNILAEFRAYGEGIVIVDQIPEKLAPDVIKNTNLKIVHRLVAKGDRELVGGAMNLTETQQRHLAALRPGEAIVYSETREYPYLVQVPNHAAHRAYKDAIVSNGQVHDHMSATCSRLTPAGMSVDDRMSKRCACPGHCASCSSAMQKNVLDLLLAHDRSKAYRSAVSLGWNGMWEFGKQVASEGNFQGAELGQAAYCLLMQLVGLGQYSTAITERVRLNIGILRDNESIRRDKANA